MKTTTAGRSHPARLERGKLFTLMVAHFFCDGYAGFLAPILPLVIKELHLSLTSASFLASMLALSSALLQPIFGYLSDRMTRSHFVALGPLLSAIFLGSMGLADSYLLLSIFLFLGGMGVSCFHPQGTALAGETGGARRGLSISLFIGAGTAGYALGPLLIVYLVSALGLRSSWLSAVPGILAALLIYALAPRERARSRAFQRTSLKTSLLPRWRAMALLMAIVVATSISRMGFLNFVPIYLEERGQSLVSGGWAVALFIAFGAVGATLGGPLSDRWGRKRTILLVILASIPSLYGYTWIGGMGWPASVFLALAGATTMASNTVLVAMSQEMLPENPGVASSLVMGLGWGIAGVALILAGNVADALGVTTTLTFLSFTPLVGLLCGAAITEKGRMQAGSVAASSQPPLPVRE
ncbi:MAG: MFS transporter [Candidatus Tectomicrobia bacterium]|uniref:MFS transporter n=1 Tax=Tectimicrobiota bacterium TaxID=2528274 RepID=A0A932CQE8_UNCTE|nr:MFS transporter [Candidatus Tectomicrobia bacterium]